MGKCWGVIPAAGIGSRMQANVPKQYLQVAGSTVLEHSVKALLACDAIDSVVIAINSSDDIARNLPGLKNSRVLFVEGGEQRSDSVLAGLHCLVDKASPDDWVLVHDAARPCILKQDIIQLIQVVMDSGVGGMLAVPVVDTLKRSGREGLVQQTVARDQLWRGQTPQMFQLGLLLKALEHAKLVGVSVTDEASAMELAGEPVRLVSGSVSNLKITVPEDLSLASFYLEHR